MNSLYFNDDHQTFRDTVKRFVERELLPAVDDIEQNGIPNELLKKCGQMGFFGISYPEQYGGLALDFFHDVVLLEEVVKCGSGGLVAAIMVQAYLATPPLLHIGSEYIRQTYLKPAIAGDLIGALAITEPNAGSDVSNIQTYAVRDGDHYIINGAKTFITNGCRADFLTLALKTDRNAGYGGISFIVVDSKTDGFQVSRKLDKLGWRASDTAELAFTDMRVPAKNLLGEEGKGFYYIMNNFQLERLVAAILMTADVEHTIKLTLKYMGEREAFGRKINKFQVLRHTIADLLSELTAVKSLNYLCAWNYNHGFYAAKEITMAKLRASELSVKNATECLQMFGGYGFMEEYPMARRFRDTRINTIGAGSSQIMRDIIAKMIIDKLEFRNYFTSDRKQ